MKPTFFLIVFVLIFFSNSAFALNETYEVNIIGKNAVVSHTILLNEEKNDSNLNLNIPIDSKGVSINIDGKYAEPTQTLINLSNVKQSIVIEYVTDLIVSNKEVIFDFDTVNSEMLNIRVILDEDGSLRHPVGKGSITTSVYPSDYTITSDGKRIIISWKRENYDKKDFSGLILLEKKQVNYLQIFFYTLLLVTIIILTLPKLFKKRKNNNATIDKSFKIDRKKKLAKRTQENKQNEDILHHLKEDEAQIVRILKNKEGSAEQGTIRVIGNFSKATLSRILVELEERNIIFKEKKGKKNVVHLNTHKSHIKAK